MSTWRVGRSAASAVGLLLAVASACSMLGVGPRYLGVLGVAADGVTFTLAIGLLDRQPAPRWVPVTRLVGVLLMNLSVPAGVIALLVAALPRVRARTHAGVDLTARG